ncbi:MAG: histidine kinase [Deltaproteobacteria bacterium]|nr:MAG: histidine kinase [Deltaproteobacteria bacterium]
MRGSKKRRTPVAKLEAQVAELQAALVRSRGVGQALRRVGQAVGAGVELDELLTLVVETTTEVLGAERATLYLLEDGKLVSRVKQGDELQTIAMEIGQGLAGHVAKSGRTLRVNDAYSDPRFDATWDERSGYRTSSAVAVPLQTNTGQTIGVLQVLNKRGGDQGPQPFTLHDAELLKALATHAVVSLEKTALLGRLLANNEQLAQTTVRLERSLRDLELLYELETLMARADTVTDMARSAITLIAGACDAAAGALLHFAENTHTLYVVNVDQPGEVREIIVQPGEGIAARAMEHCELLTIDDPMEVRDPQRVCERLKMDVHSAIAAPLGNEEIGIAGALALYNHRGQPSQFSEEDGALLKLASVNVATELRLFESRQARERSERLGSIGRLRSGMMHDLRSPLTVINGYMQLMEVADLPEAREEYGAIIAEQFEIIGAMQRDLLAYARGETALLIRKVYLSKFFDDLTRQYQPELDAAGISLQLVPCRTRVAYFDERGMARAVQNLVRNGIEALDGQGGKLTITCASDDENFVMKVSDNGPGIPKAIRRRLFEPFVTAGKVTGTGLGLANVKQVVEDHGGSVAVRSSSRGTCFTVRIPGAMRPHGLRSRRAGDQRGGSRS